MNKKHATIYFDGQCDFCKKMIPFLELESSFILVDLNTKNELRTESKIISLEELKSKIHLITKNLEVISGGEALAYILIKKKFFSKRINHAISSKTGHQIFTLIYLIVSKNRSIFNHLYTSCLRTYELNSIKLSLLNFLTLLSINIFYYTLNYPQTERFLILKWSLGSFLIFTFYSINFKNTKTISSLGLLVWNIFFALVLLFFSVKSAINLNYQNIQILLLIILTKRLTKDMGQYKKILIYSILILLFLIFFSQAEIFKNQLYFMFIFCGLVLKVKDSTKGPVSITLSQLIGNKELLLKVLTIPIFFFYLFKQLF